MDEIASVYARSLFEVARDGDELDLVREELVSFTEALDSNHQLRIFFFSPYFHPDERKKGLHAAVTGASSTMMNFVELLIEKTRLPLIYRIQKHYEKMWQEHNRRLPVTVSSAVQLDEKIVQGIGNRIAEQTGRNVDITATVEPEIIGGIVVRAGNVVLDASIHNRLERLRKHVAKAA